MKRNVKECKTQPRQTLAQGIVLTENEELSQLMPHHFYSPWLAWVSGDMHTLTHQKGEDFTVVLADRSRAHWDDTKREWTEWDFDIWDDVKKKYLLTTTPMVRKQNRTLAEQFTQDCAQRTNEIIEEHGNQPDQYTQVTPLDQAEPWEWYQEQTSVTEDDNGEDITAVFGDGSKARWTNTERSWALVRTTEAQRVVHQFTTRLDTIPPLLVDGAEPWNWTEWTARNRPALDGDIIARFTDQSEAIWKHTEREWHVYQPHSDSPTKKA